MRKTPTKMSSPNFERQELIDILNQELQPVGTHDDILQIVKLFASSFVNPRLTVGKVDLSLYRRKNPFNDEQKDFLRAFFDIKFFEKDECFLTISDSLNAHFVCDSLDAFIRIVVLEKLPFARSRQHIELKMIHFNLDDSIPTLILKTKQVFDTEYVNSLIRRFRHIREGKILECAYSTVEEMVAPESLITNHLPLLILYQMLQELTIQ